MFPLPDETIIDIHRAPFRPIAKNLDHGRQTNAGDDCDPNTSSRATCSGSQTKITTQNYMNYQTDQQEQQKKIKDSNTENLFNFDDRCVIEHEFPLIDLDKCIVVTNRSMYFIEFRDHPHIVFLNLVRESKWKACEEFCKIFDLEFNQCIEYAGDILLKKKRTTQALLTYNMAKVSCMRCKCVENKSNSNPLAGSSGEDRSQVGNVRTK